MAYITQNTTGYFGETGVLNSTAATGSAVVAPGMTLLLSSANYTFKSLLCSSLNTSANSFGAIGFPDSGPTTITLTGPIAAGVKLIFVKVGATVLTAPSGGVHLPIGQNG